MPDTRKHQEWLPLEEAAKTMNRNVSRIKSQMRNGRIQRGRHFRLVGDGEFELNVPEYLRWLEDEKETRKLPLIDRVIRGIEEGDKRILKALGTAPRPPLSATSATDFKPKLIPLHVWAEQMFGDYAPHRHTLRNWIKNGKIHPVPIKVGRSYFVSPDAEYFDAVADEIRRIVEGRR
ncbi:hypothetical protein WM11_31450 [Burkholderia ubonensis]|uniref:excisionase n=1 Tax=Burkholderia ubonensis TaxID=101571 RepID=UPI0007568E22|nr:excisionase [Burkholderia ubonensis]KVR46376.1 hypothetical protein WK18_12670 [Burkholderia ubonensis]KWB74500.1 hypothetical protein WL41_15200 [Burkholderia ubonensis]KWC20032.1 hypothetical protein WL46_21900 [Burkholderia ubonensis]KWK12941.1 hypothetical protein WM11_31450 [Burkholderia ubonensis]